MHKLLFIFLFSNEAKEEEDSIASTQGILKGMK